MTHFDDVFLTSNIRLQHQRRLQDDGHDLRTNARLRQFVRLSARKHRTYVAGFVGNLAEAYSDLFLLYEALGIGDSFMGLDRWDWNTSAGSMLDGFTGWTALDAPLINPATGLAEGDGAATVFETWKNYAKGASATSARRIWKPNATGILVGVNGAPTAAYTLQAAAGTVTYNVAPTSGHATSWGGAFWTPVHAVATLDAILRHWHSGAAVAEIAGAQFEEAHLG